MSSKFSKEYMTGMNIKSMYNLYISIHTLDVIIDIFIGKNNQPHTCHLFREVWVGVIFLLKGSLLIS